MQINWIKCSERMPPDDQPIILNDVGGCLLIRTLHLNENAKLLLNMHEFQWMPDIGDNWVNLRGFH